MRASLVQVFAFLIALALTGCSATVGAAGPPTPGSSPTPTAVAATATPTAAPTAVAASTRPVAQTGTSNDPSIAAIQEVIKRANQEQQDALAKQDPTIMQDTATSAYYGQLVQTNQDMANGGVSSIELIKLEWGSITLQDANTAQATTFETWRTTYADSSTDQGRQQNVYTLVKEQGVWKIQSDDNPENGTSPATNASGTAPSSPVTPGQPAPSATRVPQGQSDPSAVSHNWSGYAATGGQYTSVTGTWTVPDAGSTASFGSGATWVGIGGVQSHDLIQAGTDETTDGSGTAHYQAWIETLPQASRPVAFTVSPGDSVTVSLAQQSDGLWRIAFANNTTGQSYGTTVQYSSSLSSAEWIEEAPSAGRGILPLDNFGTVQFSGGSATKDGQMVTIAQAGAQALSMAGTNGQIIAQPSALTSNGKGFTVSRTNSSSPLTPYTRPSRPSRGGNGS